MEQKQHTQKFLRQRKFFTALPLLAFPFLTFIFWALGGGKGEAATAQSSQVIGFNMELPPAKSDGRQLDKLSYYELADKDSVKLKDMAKSDPYYNLRDSLLPETVQKSDTALQDNYHLNGYKKNYSILYGTQSRADANEAKVYRRLDQLNAALNNPAVEGNKVPDDYSRLHTYSPSIQSSDIDRLENMMQDMKQGGGTDTEMQQMSDMMDKLLELQHPDLVRERLRAQSEQNKKQVFPVTTTANENNITLLQGKYFSPDTLHPVPPAAQGFYGLNEEATTVLEQNGIEAVVHESQTLTNSATVKLRLLTDVYISGKLVPKGSFVFGIASLSGERLTISISSIRYQNNILPVALSVYDLDGVAGIYVPGAIARDVAKQSADQSLQGLGIGTYSTSIGAQAASAGIETAKTLLSRKVKLIKVTVKAGYRVLLRDDNAKER